MTVAVAALFAVVLIGPGAWSAWWHRRPLVYWGGRLTAPPPLEVCIFVDTAAFTAALERAGAAIRSLGRALEEPKP